MPSAVREAAGWEMNRVAPGRQQKQTLLEQKMPVNQLSPKQPRFLVPKEYEWHFFFNFKQFQAQREVELE